MIIDEILVEKYRPKDFKQFIGISNYQEIVNICNKEPFKLPHFLFVGKAGTGKTTLSRIIIKKLNADYLMLNASDESGIDTIRGKVKNFAKTMAMNQDSPKIIFLDEGDYMCLTEDTKIVTGNLENIFIREIKDLKVGREIMIPSFNLETKRIENDNGFLIDSGEAFFYEIELEDGRKINASSEHPFFDINLNEIKVKDLKIGDNILDLKEDIYKKCVICNKFIKKKNTTCSKIFK